MYFSSLAFLLPLVGLVVGQDWSLEVVKDAFDDAAVSPDFHDPPFLTDV